MQYWNFFPTAAGWGRVPVWGFADVTESRSEEIEAGRRVYGYFPMADELVVTPGTRMRTASPTSPCIASRWRLPTTATLSTDTDSLYAPGREGQQMVLVPLFFTSFVLDHDIGDNHSFGVSAAIIERVEQDVDRHRVHAERAAELRVVYLRPAGPGEVRPRGSAVITTS